MYDTLTDKQKKIVDCKMSQIIVKACPGSGKTYSVTARLAKLLNENKYRHQGIAVLSFTNNACDEIKGYLKDLCNINDVGYPHFIGTLDNFINSYIFLPFGHLIMGCDKRPEIVGTEYNKWYQYDSSIRKWNGYKNVIADPSYFFDKISFNREGKLIPLLPYSNYFWGKKDWDNQYLTDGSRLKTVISDLINAKEYHFSQGNANQADANYFAYRLLIEYPKISENLAKRFPTIIIDEAQDTTELQMAIIDILNASLENLMLIGDPNQAIFEWNTADPSLFMDKYKSEEWHHIPLDENRRSSQNICNLLNKFYNENMNSISDSKDCPLMPKLLEHDETTKPISAIKDQFLKECKDKSIHGKNIAIVFRGLSFGEQYFNLTNEYKDFEELPWQNGKYHVRDIVHGKYLIDNGKLKDGLKLLERGFFKLKNDDLKYVTSKYIQEQIEMEGFRNYRKNIFDFISSLPDTTNKTLILWIKEAEEKLNEKLEMDKRKGNLPISSYFPERAKENNFEYHLGTIHSVKGSTYDGLLVFLKKASANSDYKTILSKSYRKHNADTIKRDEEEIRIVYVACSRPKKLLWLAVYEGEHKKVWNDFLKYE